MVARMILAALLCVFGLTTVLAMPARIIILRHGEKADKWKLCDVGQQRADALAANYLGRGAAKSLFAPKEEPGAFLAITLHSLELAVPAAATWNQPIVLYAVPPRERRGRGRGDGGAEPPHARGRARPAGRLSMAR
jgi:hypothetical protein